MNIKNTFKNAFSKNSRRFLCLLIALLLCVSLIPAAGASEAEAPTASSPTPSKTPASPSPTAELPWTLSLMSGGANDPAVESVDNSAVCKLTPNKASFNTGETVQFALSAQYSTPGNASMPQTATFRIPIPATTPAVQLPMFYQTGSGAYAGVPMYPLSFQGLTVELYLMTGPGGQRWVEFTMDAGTTIQGTISMILPNGVSDSVPNFTLQPSLVSPEAYGTNVLLQGGTTAVSAAFGWNSVKKTGSTTNLGVIGENNGRIDYTVTADSQSSGLSSGRIFAQRYVLTDTISLAGLNYADGALTSSEAAGVSSFFVGGVKVLEIAAPLSALTVTKTASGGMISAFNISYEVYNTSVGLVNGSAKELPNLSLGVSLLLEGMRLNAHKEDTLVTNTAQFDAYSPFYAADNDTPATHHQSTATHTAYTTDHHDITKTAYTDAECTQEAGTVAEGQEVWYKITAHNSSSGSGPFKITDVMPAGMAYDSSEPEATVSGKTLTWDNVTIPSGGNAEFVVQAHMDAAAFTANPMRNTANLYKGTQLMASDYADLAFLSGVTDDSHIIYEKNVNDVSAGRNDKLTYTVTAKNDAANSPTRLITITDKWPGTNVRPTAVRGCTDYELLDANNTAYTFDQLAADPSIVITTIKLYNVRVPAGNSQKATVYIDGVVTTPAAEIKNEIIGSNGQNMAGTASTGVSISKGAYKFDAATGVGAALTNKDAVMADDIVCYQLSVRNLAATRISGLTVVDKLPKNLSLVSETISGATGTALLKRGNSYTPISMTAGTAASTYTPYTSGTFDLAPNESVTVYLFAQVSQAAIDASAAAGNKITNAAYAQLGGLVTADATANFYTYVDTTIEMEITKSVMFVADFNDDLTYAGTPLVSRGTPTEQNRTDAVWDGAYVCYQIQMINHSYTNQLPVYELIDTLPEGMEFVGVINQGCSFGYAGAVIPNRRDLTGLLIGDGETGIWTQTYSASYPVEMYSEEISCAYDRTTNQVHITFTDGSLMMRTRSTVTSAKPFFNIVARVKDGSEATRYENQVQAKVDKIIEPRGNASYTENGDYRYFEARVATSTIEMSPGINKKMIGHYFPSASGTPAVSTDSAVSPGETLRFEIELKNQAVSQPNNTVSSFASLRDFTVVDYLPPEYQYQANSAEVKLNVVYNKGTGLPIATQNYITAIPKGSFEPTVEAMADGRTKLTWTFSGMDTRLYNSYSGSPDAFEHVITYDTDWNENYIFSYGNYTNTATVYHSYDFANVSSGAADYDANSISASAVVSVYGAAGTSASKSVTNANGVTATGEGGSNTVGIMGKDEELTYTLDVKNATVAAQHSQIKSLVIIDELPRETGDTGVVNRTDRGSEFSVLLGADPAVTVSLVDAGGNATPVDAGKYTVRYGDSAGGLNSRGDWSQSDSGGRIAWGTDSAGKNAIRIAFDPDYSITSVQSVRVSFKAVVAEGADPGEIAWNSFGYSYQALVDGSTTEKIHAEPQKVGVAVPGAELSVSKAVTGDPAPVSTRFSFILKQNGAPVADVKYTLSGGDAVYRTDADGKFYLRADQTVKLHIAPGNGYTVEETDVPINYSFTTVEAATTGDGTKADGVFTYKTTSEGDAAGADYTNTYVKPDKIDISVQKVWAGETDPHRPDSVRVQLYDGAAAQGDPVTIDANNNWLHTWTGMDNVNEHTWSVRELDALPAGYTSALTGDAVNGFVITNTYKQPNITVTAHKTWEGNDPDRPTSVTVQLYGNNVPYKAEKTLDESNSWRCSWADLDPQVTWTVREITTLSANYSTDIQRQDNHFEITNTYTPPRPTKTAVSVSKVWAGDANPGQPTSVSVRLNKDSAAYDTQTLSATTNWAYTWNELDAGAVWTVEEVSALPAGYTSAVSGNAADGFVITNTYVTQYGSLELNKTVTGSKGEKDRLWTFTVTFSNGGSYPYTGSKSGTLTSGGTLTLKHGESVTFSGIPTGVSYTVTEREANTGGYTTTSTGAAGIIAELSVASFDNYWGVIPKMGDGSGLMLWVSALLLSGFGVFIMSGRLRRAKRKPPAHAAYHGKAERTRA